MDDVIKSAFGFTRQTEATQKATWEVTFLDSKTKIGTLRPIGDNIYVLQSSEGDYFFAASNVLYLRISTEEDDRAAYLSDPIVA